MLRQVAFVAALTALALPVVAVAADKTEKADKDVQIKLAAQNGSAQAGTITLTPQGADETKVTINIKPSGNDTPQPAHFHAGTCEKYTPAPAYALKPVVDGKSETIVPASVAKLTGPDMVVNVHKSAAEVKIVTSCAATSTMASAMKSDKNEKNEKSDKK